MYAAGLYPPAEIEATVGMLRPFDGFHHQGTIEASPRTRDQWLLMG